MKKAVFFDIFGVLYPDTLWGLADTYMRDRTDEQQAQLHDMIKWADRGFIGPDEFWTQAAEFFGVSIERLQADKKALGGLDKNLLEMAEALKKVGVITGIISNVGKGFIERAMPLDEWRRYFDVIVLSGEVGHLKPSPSIFKLAIERAGVEARNSLFFDDRDYNVQVARKVGMNAEQYHGFQPCYSVTKVFVEAES